MTQKCTSWLGHRFESRFSIGEPTITPKQCQEAFVYQSGMRDMIRDSRKRTYDCDVCVRCGAVAWSSASPPPGYRG